MKSLEIEEKINQIRWLKRKNASHFLLSTNDKTVKLWKISEKTKRAEGFNLRDDNGMIRSADSLTDLRIPVIRFDEGQKQKMTFISVDFFSSLIFSLSIETLENLQQKT